MFASRNQPLATESSSSRHAGGSGVPRAIRNVPALSDCDCPARVIDVHGRKLGLFTERATNLIRQISAGRWWTSLVSDGFIPRTLPPQRDSCRTGIRDSWRSLPRTASASRVSRTDCRLGCASTDHFDPAWGASREGMVTCEYLFQLTRA